MDSDFLIKLTNNLYRLTLLFPKKEPLKYKMREVSLEILKDFLKDNQQNDSFKIRKELEVLIAFLEIALIQNWVKNSDLLAIKEDYNNFKNNLKQGKTKEKNIDQKPEPILLAQKSFQESQPSFQVQEKKINQRQEKILEYLKENDRAQVWQIKAIMPDVAKRTLRRDFEYMVDQKLIKRIGEKNDTFYQIKTS